MWTFVSSIAPSVPRAGCLFIYLPLLRARLPGHLRVPRIYVFIYLAPRTPPPFARR